ncbi:hypothetical protein RCIA184 [Methanocella arvoryzae MRE50]|uniref:Uncharacterized protein n=1 Tax=Methanocella arvoryzae (strain DSM 22066 / NBRC 105507 / MRE50) TaxID=351160 RepID=Q0W216_METAR|nr:hypothetical protein RCIA184 [Methanocella arvoryzae MRE50]
MQNCKSWGVLQYDQSSEQHTTGLKRRYERPGAGRDKGKIYQTAEASRRVTGDSEDDSCQVIFQSFLQSVGPNINSRVTFIFNN